MLLALPNTELREVGVKIDACLIYLILSFCLLIFKFKYRYIFTNAAHLATAFESRQNS